MCVSVLPGALRLEPDVRLNMRERAGACVNAAPVCVSEDKGVTPAGRAPVSQSCFSGFYGHVCLSHRLQTRLHPRKNTTLFSLF